MIVLVEMELVRMNVEVSQVIFSFYPADGLAPRLMCGTTNCIERILDCCVHNTYVMSIWTSYIPYINTTLTQQLPLTPCASNWHRT